MTETSMTAPAAGQVAREDFAGREIAVTGETAATAAAAQATAIVQARYLMALKRPRDMDDVRVRIMREVERPGFAEVAWYVKPIGAGVQGLSIRFAEAAMRCMGNLLPESPIVYDSPTFRMLRVMLTDLESNLTWSKDVIVEKTVERRQLRRGQVALQVRTNSAGETTYLVQATEDEVASKEGSNVSKVMRTHALRLLPGDIQDAAKKRILEIRSGEAEKAAKDPDGARKKIVDAFALLNVMPSDLKRFLGHDIGTASPAELQDLRDVHSAIKSGDATWAEVLEGREGEAPKDGPAPKAGLAGVTEKLEQKRAATTPPPPAEPAAPSVDLPKKADAPRGEPGSSCPNHALLTVVNPDGSRACDEQGCEWTAPAPPRARDREPGDDDEDIRPAPKAVAAVQDLAAKAGDTSKPPAKSRQRNLEG